jgi:hypothetical protein
MEGDPDMTAIFQCTGGVPNNLFTEGTRYVGRPEAGGWMVTDNLGHERFLLDEPEPHFIVANAPNPGMHSFFSIPRHAYFKRLET